MDDALQYWPSGYMTRGCSAGYGNATRGTQSTLLLGRELGLAAMAALRSYPYHRRASTASAPS